jgi:hypothetical protein
VNAKKHQFVLESLHYSLNSVFGQHEESWNFPQIEEALISKRSRSNGSSFSRGDGVRSVTFLSEVAPARASNQDFRGQNMEYSCVDGRIGYPSVRHIIIYMVTGSWRTF